MSTPKTEPQQERKSLFSIQVDDIIIQRIFKTLEDAQIFEQSMDDDTIEVQKLSFTQGGNYAIKTGTGNGVHEIDEELGIINITYDVS